VRGVASISIRPRETNGGNEMKKLVIVPVLIGLVFMLLSCAGGPKGELKEKENPKTEALVIDHKNKALGGAVLLGGVAFALMKVAKK